MKTFAYFSILMLSLQKQLNNVCEVSAFLFMFFPGLNI